VYQLAIPAPKQSSNRSTSPRAAARPCSMATPHAVNVTCHLCSQTRLERAYACGDLHRRLPSHRIYRTAPLAGLFSHQKGGFYHDGRFATLPDVVNHYDQCMNLGLSDDEKTDLLQYLLTL